jgi:hypothetical protein
LKYFISPGSSAELSLNFIIMKAMKCILPLFLFMFIGLISQAQVTAETTVKNAKAEKTTCQKVCAPVACKALAKAGICSPEQAAKCQKDGKMASTESNIPFATEVAAVSQSRTTVNEAKSKETNCAKKCVKTCGSKKGN